MTAQEQPHPSGDGRKERRAQRKAAMWKAARKAPYIKPAPILVYFIREDGRGYIKIGIAKDVPKRLLTLQTGSPHRLEVLAACEGDRMVEMGLHKAFAPDRVSGEWFKPTDRLLEVIERARTLAHAI